MLLTVPKCFYKVVSADKHFRHVLHEVDWFQAAQACNFGIPFPGHIPRTGQLETRGGAKPSAAFHGLLTIHEKVVRLDLGMYG